MSSFEGQNMQAQCNVLNYSIDLYFHDYKLTIEFDENGHRDRNIEHKIKRQKTINQELGCKFIRNDPDKEEFDIFKTVNEIFRHVKQSAKKTLINKISSILLRLEFISDDITKSKLSNLLFKKYFLMISNNENVLRQL